MSNIAYYPSNWLGRAKNTLEMLKCVSDKDMKESIKTIFLKATIVLQKDTSESKIVNKAPRSTALD